MPSSSPSTWVDSTDARVQYQSDTGQWQQVRLSNASLHKTSAGTPTARVSLSFAGITVHVIGTVPPTDDAGRPTSRYFIDDDVNPVGNYTPPFVSTSEGDRFNVTFFSSQTLALGKHTITVENMDGQGGAPDGGPAFLFLDYFLIDTDSGSSSAASKTKPSTPPTFPSPSAAIKPNTSASNAATAVASVTTATSGVTQTSATNTSSTPNTNPPRAERLNLGVIVGSAVGGVAIVAVIVLAFFCSRRRRRLHVGQEADASVRPARGPSVTFSPSPHPSITYSLTSSAMLSTRAVVALAVNVGHRSSTAPPREALPGPSKRASSSSTHPMPAGCAPPPISEKSPGLSLPNVRASPAPSPPGAGTPEATTLAALAPLPPGVWHAPPDYPGAPSSLFRSLFSNGSRAHLPFSLSGGLTMPQAADSGLRLCDDMVLPPPYTRD